MLSRRVEQRLGWRKKWSNWWLAIKGGYDLTYSTNQVAIKNPEIEAGDQLVYVPRHSGFAQVSLSLQSWDWIYQHTYTGTVLTLLNTELPSYFIANTSLQYQLANKGHIFLKVNNLYNKNYRVIARRAMPLRHYRLGVRVDICGKK